MHIKMDLLWVISRTAELQNFEKIESFENEQNALIMRAVRSKENEFNTFLEKDGYPYKIEISLSDKDEAALILKDANTAHPASKTKEYLSYGGSCAEGWCRGPL